MRLLLVRHGESTWNVEGRYQGRKDPPLSALGEAQARALAAFLSAALDDVRPRTIIASPLARALRTAEIVASALDLEVAIDRRLIEISHGAWEGLLKGEVEESWPRMMADWRTRPDRVVFPGGESLAEVRARWHQCFSELQRFSSPIMVVTHDVLVRLCAADVRGTDRAAFNDIHIANASISIVDVRDGAIVWSRFNDVGHLGDLHRDVSGQAL